MVISDHSVERERDCKQNSYIVKPLFKKQQIKTDWLNRHVKYGPDIGFNKEWNFKSVLSRHNL